MVNCLLYALQNFDYTLAIVPITGGPLWQDADPSSELRSQLPSAAAELARRFQSTRLGATPSAGLRSAAMTSQLVGSWGRKDSA